MRETLAVTFWDPELFRSVTGVEMDLSISSIEHPIWPQTTTRAKTAIETLGKTVATIVGVTLGLGALLNFFLAISL